MEENIKAVRSRDYVRSYEMKVAIMTELEGERDYFLMDQIALAPEVKEVQRRELELLYLKIKQIAQVTGKHIDSRLIESIIMQTNFTKKRKRKKSAGNRNDTSSMEKVDSAMTQKTKVKENPHPEFVIEGTTLVRYNNEEQLTEVTIPHEITDIAKEAFLNADITKVNIPATVKSIGAGAFRNCANLSEIKIPGSVKRIEDYTFSGCKSLRIAFLVYGVEYIGKYAFMEATSLKMINLSKSLKMID
ncbi:MAG: leucine-rich repeat domain-containing protein, partial [Clostridia bacterium]|nr:leucine-rich repeat domain-containing protein [Clostridia bacterium]